MNAAELRLQADKVRAKLKEEQKNMNRVKEVVVTANTTGAQEAKEQKKLEKIEPAPMVKHIERMETQATKTTIEVESVVGAETGLSQVGICVDYDIFLNPEGLDEAMKQQDDIDVAPLSA